MTDEKVFTDPIFLVGMGFTFITLIGLLVVSRDRPKVFWSRVGCSIGLIALVYVLYFMLGLLFAYLGGQLLWLVVVFVILVLMLESWWGQQRP